MIFSIISLKPDAPLSKSASESLQIIQNFHNFSISIICSFILLFFHVTIPDVAKLRFRSFFARFSLTNIEWMQDSEEGKFEAFS